jgi:hypothetical protein
MQQLRPLQASKAALQQQQLCYCQQLLSAGHWQQLPASTAIIPVLYWHPKQRAQLFVCQQQQQQQQYWQGSCSRVSADKRWYASWRACICIENLLALPVTCIVNGHTRLVA